ncbi:MAG: ABC transporter permease [Lewinella sp.]|jgi:putative ABC transport system permease protein|uniref:ABC transporter permease n=1 Tax=Lewinella sp. TaxID=2004506 RepID=UPI003D6A903B
MRIFFKIFTESIRQASQQLSGNKLRSFLSLLGISIGIFCIIGVLSAVDSLEDNIRGSMEKLGNDVLYVQKWPWGDNSSNWWDLMKRPTPRYEEYEVINDKARSAQMSTFFLGAGSRTLKWKNNSVERSFLCGVTPEFVSVFGIGFHRGRFFSASESFYASNKVVLGFTVAEELFGSVEPVGKSIKLQGGTYEVIGVLESSGDELINPLDFDEAVIVTYNKVSRLVNVKGNNTDSFIAVKARPGVSLEKLKGELRILVRSQRRLNPREEDTFAFNELTVVSEQFDSFFGVLNLLGGVIGFFSILVGGVSVANIMFVSVKERTSQIGVKKALGAKRHIILSEFLIEAIILCLLGGAMGLGLVFLITKILTAALDFPIYIDLGNVLLGAGMSIIIGVVAGFIPAVQASKLDPVEAMRQ